MTAPMLMVTMTARILMVMTVVVMMMLMLMTTLTTISMAFWMLKITVDDENVGGDDDTANGFCHVRDEEEYDHLGDDDLVADVDNEFDDDLGDDNHGRQRRYCQ